MKTRAVNVNGTLVQPFVYTQQALPIDKPVVQYIRQSTKRQQKRNKQSYELQDADLRNMLVNGYGWKDNDRMIIKIDADQGKSGTMRRDQRTGLDLLYSLVEMGQTGAVAAYDVSRLYRVLSRAEYGAFCDLVLEKKIPVITNHRIYWPNRTDNDQLADDFRAAAVFIEEIIKGKLIAAKNRHIQYDASYGGGAIPIGYIVAGMGNDSASRKYFVIYEPHAKLIRWLFKRFRELGGNIPLLYRELKQTDFRFPAFERGITPNVGLRADKDGTYPLRSRDAIISILTNRAYIGQYAFGGVLVSEHAHDAIVDLDDFLYAWERLSRVSLDGQAEQEPAKRERRYGGAMALLDGIVGSNGLAVYVIANEYRVMNRVDGFDRTELVVPVKDLDIAFAQAMIAALITLEKAHQAGLEEEIYKRVKALQEQQEQQEAKYANALARIDREIVNTEMARRVSQEEGDERGYRDTTRTLVQLRKDRKAIEEKANEAGKEASLLEECHALIDCAICRWDAMKIENKKRLVSLLVESANLTAVSPHFVRLDVLLGEPVQRSLTLLLPRANASKKQWKDEEIAVLQALYPTASKRAVMQAIPMHSWGAIAKKALTMRLKRATSTNRSYQCPDNVAYSDLEVMERYGAMLDKPTWRVNEIHSCTPMCQKACACLDTFRIPTPDAINRVPTERRIEVRGTLVKLALHNSPDFKNEILRGFAPIIS